MKIAILNGSPREENTAAMVEAFRQGAESAGHDVEVLHVGKMKINGCLACEYCHGAGEGKCIQKDDIEEIMPAYLESEMIVFASPLYYATLTAQIEAAIQRVYCIGKPMKAVKAALLLSSATGSYDAAIARYKAYTGFTGIEDMGICTATGEENKSEAKMAEIRAFAEGL